MEDREMTLVEHLSELRKGIIRAFIGFFAAMAVTWVFHEQIFRFLAKPVMRGLAVHGVTALQAIDVMEGISVYLKASMAAAFVLSSPWLIWQAASFIAPALRRKERRLFALGTFLVVLFFVLGVVFSYSIFVPVVVEFLAGFGVGSGDLTLAPTIQNTFGLAMFFMIVFGFIFELPLVMMFAGILHLISPRTFAKYLRHFIVAAFILAAVFTPPEPVSQTLMAIPLCLLYGLGILMAWAGWMAGGNDARGRAVIATTGAVLLFAAGIIGAASFWNSRTPAAAVPAEDARHQTQIEINAACTSILSGWKLSPDEKITVSFGPEDTSGVVFRASGRTVLTLPGEHAASVVDRFIHDNAGRTWFATRDGESTVMVSVTPAEARDFLSRLVAETGRRCR